jgi:hypothetical protein
MPNNLYTTPILLLVFNRPGFTQQVFQAVRAQRPSRLFVAADGPRPDHQEDVEKCRLTREVLKQIDWPCELQTCYRDRNLGCGRGPAEAITWFFSQVEQGIILEDDCLPHPGFFSFCGELLPRYKEDEKIAIISGTNPLQKWKFKHSYFFSAWGSTWGWASWRRAWNLFDYSMAAWQSTAAKESVKNFLKNHEFYQHFQHEFDAYLNYEKNDVWDFQWLFSRLAHSACAIVPSVNMISNIGFGQDATHTFNTHDQVANLPTFQLTQTGKPQKVKIDRLYDWIMFQRFINRKKRTLPKRAILKLIKIVFGTNHPANQPTL